MRFSEKNGKIIVGAPTSGKSWSPLPSGDQKSYNSRKRYYVECPWKPVCDGIPLVIATLTCWNSTSYMSPWHSYHKIYIKPLQHQLLVPRASGSASASLRMRCRRWQWWNRRSRWGWERRRQGGAQGSRRSPRTDWGSRSGLLLHTFRAQAPIVNIDVQKIWPKMKINIQWRSEKNYIGGQIMELWVTRMHSSRMRTDCLLIVCCSSEGGGVCPTDPWRQTTLEADRLGKTSPWGQNSPGWRCPGWRPPWRKTSPQRQTSLNAEPADQNHLPVNRMTHRCKNNTLPQNSSAGGSNLHSILNVFPISQKTIETMLVPFIYVLILSLTANRKFLLPVIGGYKMGCGRPALSLSCFFSCSFRQKFYQIVDFHSKLKGRRCAPSLSGKSCIRHSLCLLRSIEGLWREIVSTHCYRLMPGK